ncbi:unnamed protein product [Fraxinus pennsylvanica]|uniref:Uncharacterized protein n=1 Tax=Fraxinus pennsylvanica TaxID=56036 RepID=A0AAD1YXU1_9LAMI|nr:unnamed protein product [Fraxinus pennsylvanica]
MASACVNNIGMSPESFLDCPPSKYPSYGWLSSRISFSREFVDEEEVKAGVVKPSAKTEAKSDNAVVEKSEKSDPEVSGETFVDFEFRLEDPVTMLPADELFSDGKLMPLQISSIQKSMRSAPMTSAVTSPDTPKLRIRTEISLTDPYLFSPKAPRCSSRWKELLGLKKLYQNSNAKPEDQKPASASNSKNAAKSLKHFLHRSSKSSVNASIDSSLSFPLLKDTDNESVSISSRLSLSSSSSGHEHDDLPRLSLDSDEPSTVTRSSNRNTNTLSRVRVVRPRALSPENPNTATRVVRSPMQKAPEPIAQACGVSADSPRMNSSGKVVFNNLERSSSSPSSFNGGPRYKHRGMERSYSANVRVTPVLNVPVCSLRVSSKSGVFGLFSSQQKKDSGGGSSNSGGIRGQQNNSKEPHGLNSRDGKHVLRRRTEEEAKKDFDVQLLDNSKQTFQTSSSLLACTCSLLPLPL